MNTIRFALILLFTVSAALAVETELSGNIEGQGRYLWNNPEAKGPPLYQVWDEDNFWLIYGNLNGKMQFEKSKIEANWFTRHSYSPLYINRFLITDVLTFPRTLVARDMFKLQHTKEGRTTKTESVINKLFYEWNPEGYRLTVGRMYINYGQGEVFNPMNPFNQPTGLTSISQVAQGNDGLGLTVFYKDSLAVDIYLLGDKRIEGYDGSIDRTLWLHAEYQANEKLQLDLVAGEDQNRRKLGGQINYKFEKAMVFSQALYQSVYTESRISSEDLLDLMLGYDQQLNSLWHLRLEGGYQEMNDYATPQSFERFLPTEYFIAVVNQLEVHPLLKISGTLINDIKTQFNYFIFRATLSLHDNVEAEFIGSSPISQGDAPDNLSQRLVTSDLGLALRAFF